MPHWGLVIHQLLLLSLAMLQTHCIIIGLIHVAGAGI